MKSSRVCSDCLSEGAKINSSHIALESGERKISYSELQSLSARFTEGGSTPVALWSEKTPEAVAAILGILSSGRTCVPIDPLNPPERALRILKDSGAGKIFISSRQLEKSREFLSETSIQVIEIEKLAASQSFEKRASPDDLAYLLYTSGSTGDPKGVMISNRAAMTFIDWSKEFFELQSSDRVASVAPFHFDLSFFDLFATLSRGATVCLCPREILVFPESTLDWISQSKITTLYTTPSLLASIASSNGLERLASVKRFLFAGEVMPPRILAKLMEAVPNAKFYNLYGPTETNVCTYLEVSRPFHSETDVPIGIPCLYNRVEIVDSSGRPVKPGVIGEIRVEGPNLMSGYWNSQKISESHLTGDFGWKDEDGIFHFQGRRDEMLKINGYRVEAGEVEVAICSHPDVCRAAIYKKSGLSGETLVAAVVLEKEIGIKELKSFCREKLPPYMVPSEIEIYSELPLNANGKIDRQALALGR
jgi:L-proline---[L-prolyl-carrier protein] ligase